MKIQVIVGSTRPGRVSDRLAQWVVNEIQKNESTEAELVDLMDYQMPFLDETISPQYNPDRKPNPEAKKWLDKLSEADGYVIVTPEYNRAISGVLKNALDYIDFQFAKKPVALVAHGSTGGAQAIANLRMIIPGLQAVTVPTALFYLPRVGESISESGELSEDIKAMAYGPQSALNTLIENLLWYTKSLKAGRA
jgi:NAD(P)H-dependent FMN reductase